MSSGNHPPQPPALPGWSDYQLLGPLGQGASGGVHLARRSGDGSLVALKSFHEEFRQQAAHEAAILAGIRFPGVVRLRDTFLAADGRSLLAVFEYLEGVDLFTATEHRGLEQSAPILADLLRALAFVHRRGLVHRDLKPANLLVHQVDGEARGTLIDFGMAADVSDPMARGAGTLGYLAPEVLEGGAPDQRSDLYSFGVVLYQVLSRQLPAEGLDPVEVVRLHCGGDLVLPEQTARQLPPALVDLVHTLLRRDPAQRVAECVEVLEHLSRSIGVGFELETEETLLGRIDSIQTELLPDQEALQPILQAGLGSGSVRLTAPAGSGLLLQNLRNGWAAAGRAVARLDRDQAVTSAAESLIRSLPEAGGVVLIDGTDRLDLRDQVGFEASLAAADSHPGSVCLVVVTDDEALLPDDLLPGARSLVVSRPTAEQIERAIERELGLDTGPARLRRLRAVEGFTPGSVREGLAAMVAAGIVLRDGDRLQWNARAEPDRIVAADTVARARRRVGSLPLEVRDLLRIVGLSTRPVPLAAVIECAAGAGLDDAAIRACLKDSHWLELDPESDTLAPASEALSQAVIAELADVERTELRRTLARALVRHAGQDANRVGGAGMLLLACGDEQEALPHLIDAGIRLRSAGHSAAARRYLERALPLCPGPTRPVERVRVLRWLADCASLERRLDEAARLAGEAVRLAGDPSDTGRCHVVLARVWHGRGDPEAAERCIAGGLALAGTDPLTRTQLLTTRSTILREGRLLDQAVEVAEEAVAQAGAEPSLERGAAIIAYANALAHQGRVDDAADRYREAERDGRRLARDDMTAYAVANLGRLLVEHGRIEDAVAVLEPVLTRFEQTGAIRHAHSLLVTLLLCRNLQGDLAAARELGRKGHTFFGRESSRLHRAMFLRHLAETELRAGNPGEAERLIEESIEIRERTASRDIVAIGLAIRARTASWTGSEQARERLCQALRSARQSNVDEALEESLSAAAEHHLDTSRPGAARLAARRAVRRARRMRPARNLPRACAIHCLALLDLGSPEEVVRRVDELSAEHGGSGQGVAWALLQGARAAALGARGEDEPVRAGFQSALDQLTADGHALERARVLLLRSGFYRDQALSRRNDVVAEEVLNTAAELRNCHADLAAARALYRALHHAGGEARATAMSTRLELLESADGAAQASFIGVERRIHTLDRLLEINKALNSELDPERLLNLILDAAIELCGARRGFLVLVRGKSISVRVARNFAEQDIHQPEFEFSHSVARQVAQSGDPLLSSNALHDKRLKSIESIAELQVTSILCAPLRGKDQLLGSIYLDHPDVIDRFDEGDLESLSDLASAAGVALERARMVQENVERANALVRAKQEIERLNSELLEKVADQAKELDSAKITIEAERRATALRYDYRNIITQSSRMQDVLKLLDRITDTDLPVLIQGDSGTGKELVARAIHFNGKRARDSFVSVNCAAMAEPLIEAELFGHVKGAFTGADRDRKGLFEIADGGTLFLDEIGDMSMEVQKRLLRVVQYGEFFRVGGKEPVHVQVRIISATHRNLKERIVAGRFREDLFYRLNVAPVFLPPVRERAGDVPLLVRHFERELDEGGMSGGKQFSREAMEAMERYSWPGNVREIQNEVKRLMFLESERRTIEVEDLAPAIRSAWKADREVEEGGSLRELLEQKERVIIERALRRAGGNKTEAARRLGVSARGLYKILHRIGLAGEGSDRSPGVPAQGSRPEGRSSQNQGP